MLRRITDITGSGVTGSDGDIGPIRDVYFDDEKWVVRYLIVDTGGWLGSEVLVSPIAVSSIDWNGRVVHVGMTKDEIADSPSIHTHKPVSRHDETRYYAYLGFDPYWSSSAIWPVAASPGLMADETLASLRARHSASHARRSLAADAGDSAADVHLRSASEVKGYHIMATDGRIGHIDDFFIDEANWAIRAIDVDTSNWLGGTAVAIDRDAIQEVVWPEGIVSVSMTRSEVEQAPRTDQLAAFGSRSPARRG